ncbi:hypothetical protein PGB90_001020 [Kerria lacca]
MVEEGETVCVVSDISVFCTAAAFLLLDFLPLLFVAVVVTIPEAVLIAVNDTGDPAAGSTT